MAVVPLYKQPGPKAQMLDALRRGMTRAEAAEAGGGKAQTFAHWVDRDAVWQLEVEAAEREAKATGATMTAKVARDPKTGGDRWQRIKAEAEAFGGGMFGSLLAIEARVLAMPGAVGLSPFMRHVALDFYASGAHELCLIMGRGGSKSTANIFFCSNELIFRERHIPPNDPRWIWPFMSHSMPESNQRVEPFKRTLMAIGYRDDGTDLIVYSRKDGRSEIQFDDAKGQPVKINIFPNTVDACRGGNLAGATDDEELFWQADKDKGLSRADDVLAVLVGALRADRSRVHIRISSVNDAGGAMLEAAEAGSDELRFVPTLGPFLGTALDGFTRVAAHLETIGLPDGAQRVRAWAATLAESSPWIPSWVGNPSHDPVEGFKLLWSKLRRDQDRLGIWLRENGSCTLPVGASGALFEHDLVERARAAVRYPGAGERFAAIDTGAKKNPAALCIVERVAHRGAYQWRPVLLRQWRRERGGMPLDLRGVVLPAMARLVLAHDCAHAWWSDGWSGHDVELVGAEHGLATHYVSTSTAMRDICAPFESALSLARGDAVALSGCDGIEETIAQLRGVRAGPSGSVVWPEAGQDHGELVQVLLRAMAHARIGELAGAEAQKPQRFVFGGDRYSATRQGFSGR
jgi:hypothetical protein